MVNLNKIYHAVKKDLTKIIPLENIHSLDSRISELRSTIEGAEFSINGVYGAGVDITKESVDLAKSCLFETGQAIKDIASSGDTRELVEDYLDKLREMCAKTTIIKSRYDFSQTQGYNYN